MLNGSNALHHVNQDDSFEFYSKRHEYLVGRRFRMGWFQGEDENGVFTIGALDDMEFPFILRKA